MPRCTLANYFLHILKQMLSIKFFFLVSFVSFVLSILWIQLASSQAQPPVNESLVQEALDNVARDYRYSNVYRKTSKLPKDFKYILLWTRDDYAPFYYFGKGPRAFLKNNCSVTNCYVTSDRSFFNGDITKFDAVAFNGRNMQNVDLPKMRSTKQKYIFFNMESADNYPVCGEEFDGFFNWTATYKLNSDIPFPYIQVRNSVGEVVGPKLQTRWTRDLPEIDEEYSYRLQNKTKAAAWFVSHCKSRSGREEFVENLQKALDKYGHTVDIYGACGTLKCPKGKKFDCDTLLERDYYFYMSLENSFAEDYVTEKLLTALQHDVVPVIYGGANYSRFLPPGSYLDGMKHDPDKLALIMDQMIKNPRLYCEYFRWKSKYSYQDPSEVDDVCAVCAALHDKTMIETPSTYDSFRKWWNPQFQERC